MIDKSKLLEQILDASKENNRMTVADIYEAKEDPVALLIPNLIGSLNIYLPIKTVFGDIPLIEYTVGAFGGDYQVRGVSVGVVDNDHVEVYGPKGFRPENKMHESDDEMIAVYAKGE